MTKRALVTGAGGFIGYHLVNRLKDEGYWVLGIDLKRPQFGESRADRFELVDLRSNRYRNDLPLDLLFAGIDEVYALAADMGGMGYITDNNAKILHYNTLINFNTIEAAWLAGVGKYFFSSSVCVYPREYQERGLDPIRFGRALLEDYAVPANPMLAYGWEKLLSEKLCEYYWQDYGFDARVARFGNIYGPYGTWFGGREKAPAALCRKVAYAKLTSQKQIKIWGDGLQLRTFTYITDLVNGIRCIMQPERDNYCGPFNICDESTLIAIGVLARTILEIADYKAEVISEEGPVGADSRLERSSLIRNVLDWRPKVTLREGLAETYSWIEKLVAEKLSGKDVFIG